MTVDTTTGRQANVETQQEAGQVRGSCSQASQEAAQDSEAPDMSRGKHGRAAEVRREAHEQQAEIGTYQRRVADLVAKLKKAEAEADELRQRHAKEIRSLRVQVREGISPALAVAEREAKQFRDQRDAAQQRLSDRQRGDDAFFRRLMDYLESTGVRHADAVELFLVLNGRDGHDTVVLDNKNLKGLAPEQVRAIQRARGERA